MAINVERAGSAAARHPISTLLGTVRHLLVPGPLPFQKARATYGYG